jgi:hypothetical protein
MIAAEHHGQMACLQLRVKRVMQSAVPFCDFFQMPKAIDRSLLRVGWPLQIAAVFHLQTEIRNRLRNARHAQGLWAHARATRARANVGGHAYEANARL